MSNVIFDEEYDILPGLLLAERRRAGLSQKALARRMRRCASHIHKLETRQTRIEIVEFCRYIQALDGDPIDVLSRFLSRFACEKKAA